MADAKNIPVPEGLDEEALETLKKLGLVGGGEELSPDNPRVVSTEGWRPYRPGTSSDPGLEMRAQGEWEGKALYLTRQDTYDYHIVTDDHDVKVLVMVKKGKPPS